MLAQLVLLLLALSLASIIFSYFKKPSYCFIQPCSPYHRQLTLAQMGDGIVAICEATPTSYTHSLWALENSRDLEPIFAYS